MSVFRQFKHKKNGKEEIVDLGALAQNITEDSTHRFVSDTEKQNWNNKMDAVGDIANAKVSFSQASSRANINTNETVATIAGKIKKWYVDFKAVVWSGSYNDLVNKPTLGTAASQGLANNLTTTAAGFAMDARQGPVIQEKFNQINSDLGALNDGGAIKGMDAREDGVYITYSAGADTVTKKLGDIPSKLFCISNGINGSNNVQVPGGEYYFIVSVWATGGAGNCSIISFPGTFILLGSAAIEENGNSKVFLFKIENATAGSASVYVNAPGSSHGVRFYSLTR